MNTHSDLLPYDSHNRNAAPIPVPEKPTPLPPEMPQPAQPIGEPSPMENPIPMREPPATLPPQS